MDVLYFWVESALRNADLSFVPGAVSEQQGWELKRLLSFTKNRLVNRPNRPRDKALRDFMSAIGVEWPENDEQSDDGESQEETAEESLTDTDEEVEPEEIHVPKGSGSEQKRETKTTDSALPRELSTRKGGESGGGGGSCVV